MKIIDTAQAMPTSGHFVLAWLEGSKIPMRALWADKFSLGVSAEQDPEWGEYCEEKDEYFCPAGWYEMNQHEESHWRVDGNVVAWCELPRLEAGAAPAAVAPRGEYPHEQMDAMALDRYKVVPSNASMLWSHAVVAGDGAQQLYVGREVECQNMARKFAGAFLDGAFAFHSMAAAPTAQAAPALEAPAAPAGDEEAAFKKWFQGEQGKPYQGMWDFARAAWMARAATAAAPQAPAAPVVDDEGCLSDELRDLITGMTVSVDVSTGEHDAGNRLFGEVTEVMEYDGGSDKHKVVLLVQSPEANFKAAPAAPAVDALSQAARDVLAERQRQIDVEGWTPEHDDEHSDGFMSMAAACYALAQLPGPRPYAFHTLYLWTFTGWSQSWFKVSDRRRNLVKAAALNIAELERLDRAAAQAKEGGA